MNAVNTLAPANERAWKASLRAEFQNKAGRGVLAHLQHEGPLRMQRLFWPEDPSCPHGYLLHPPGGLAPGDQLDIAVTLQAGSAALLTTPSANRIYRTDDSGHRQTQINRLILKDKAELEWLPQETIVFDRARSEQILNVEASGDSRFFVWDMQILGRAGSKAPFDSGSSLQQLAVWRDKHLVLKERFLVSGGSSLQTASWGLAEYPCFGTWIAGFLEEQQAKSLLQAVRETVCEEACWNTDSLRWSFTRCDGLLVGRVQAQNSETLQQFMTACWQHLRPKLLGREACRPRVWDT